jgi:hypothetical protein
MGVDANQGYGIGALGSLMARSESANISLLEQPIKRGREADLDGFMSRRSRLPPMKECSLSRRSSPASSDDFKVVNIKLDKCGGLTEGLAMAREARRLGLGSWSATWWVRAWRWRRRSCSDNSAMWWIWTVRFSLAKDRTPGMTYVDGTAWSDDQVWEHGTAAPA